MEYFLIAGVAVTLIMIILSLYGPAPVIEGKRARALEILDLRYRLTAMTAAYAKANTEKFAANQLKQLSQKLVYRDEKLQAWRVYWVIRDRDLVAARVSPAMIEKFLGT